MQLAAQDVGRLSRLVAGGAGLAVAATGLAGLVSRNSSSPAAALLAAGLALFLLAPAQAGRIRRGIAYALAALAAAVGAVVLVHRPATGVAMLLTGLALAGLDAQLRRRPDDPARYRVADPLLAGASTITLVALVPRMFAPTFPDGGGPDSVMSPVHAGALLTLAVGALLARPEAGPLRTTAAAGPGVKVRRALPVAIAVPVVAALVSALAVRTGISRPAAAISTGAILAALAVLAFVGLLVRSLEGADRQQRELVTMLHERRDFADTLLQSMNEAVMVLDANHRVIDVNRRWRELTGHLDGDGPPGPPALPPPGTGDWVVRRADGTDVPVLATMATIPDATGQPRGYVATYVDITERKRVEDELSSRAEELTLSNERLREANARLEAALTFKNDLTSMLTHDVAQPVSSIASLAELLHADWVDLPDDIRLELVQKIDKNTHRLIKMMNDLQLLFRLDTGTVTARRTPVPLAEVVASVISELNCAGTVEVSVGEDVSALADRQHVWHVVRNLLSNALAYGEAPVRVRCDRTGETVVLMVEDNGPGIPAELVPKLFDRFMRGAGLGLFIVRHLVEANGGSVRYERTEPHGACLVVTLEAAAI
ncbi:HAMP domain-containing sensor histidine kinase [Actinoplanes sp. TFC3]|uniref:PAS domain-containing sensor histidine kinase n=1 Tax=Actinoplanes sp. TFC3 TaxID=1710355 RepID=UPI00082981FB|nr:HAMP domain-containing sensor histidine kinase [Actinoplanes sp. TFC3]